MKRKIILRLSFLIAFLTLLWSCRNEDFVQAEKNPQRNNRDFFKHSKKGGAFAKTTTDYVDILEAYNREKNFLSAMPDQQGMPIWDKMRIVKTENSTSLVIPLSEDNATMSSVFFALIDNKENTVKAINNITNDELRRVVFDPTIDVQKRESLFYTFMAVDNYTFGNEVFTNIPQDLFVDDKLGEQNNRIVFHAPRFGDALATETTTQNGRVQVVYEVICVIIRHCTHHGGGSCDGCSQCKTESCSHSTTLVFTYPDPETGVIIYGYPEGGGGGGTPLPIPDPDPCGLSRAFYRLAPNCNGSTPVNPPQNPCETLKEMMQQTKVKDSIEFIKTKTTGKQEFAIEIYKEDTGFRTRLRVGTQFATSVATGGDIRGQAHNHPIDGQSIPSFGDVKWLRVCKQNIYPPNAVAYNIVVCANPATPNDLNTAITYAIVVDSSNFPALIAQVDAIWNRPDLQGESDSEKMKIINNEYGEKFGDVQYNSAGMEKKFLELYQNFGLNLMRFNKTTQKWEKLVIENNTVTPKPCPQ